MSTERALFGKMWRDMKVARVRENFPYGVDLWDFGPQRPRSARCIPLFYYTTLGPRCQ